MRLLIAAIALFLSVQGYAADAVNVYNWSNYLPQSVLTQFTQKTGIEVNYAEYDSNETLYAKLKGNPNIGYDVIFPSNYYVAKMANEGMLLPLDKNRIPNQALLRPALMGRPFDPNNNYSLPYIWGATGIAYNDKTYNKSNLTDWNSFWDSTYKNKLLLLNDNREVFAIALMRLGYSINDKDPKHIQQAYQLLKKLMRNVKLINTVSANNLFLDEDVQLGMNWNGEVTQIQQENPHVHFIYPKRFVMWLDCIAVAAHAPHPVAAMKFINFILSASISAEISNSLGYSPTNTQAMRHMPIHKQQNPTFNPPTAVLRQAGMLTSVGEANRWYTHYWQLLKLGA
jgi:spermidine/putrescine transport system substrate-binding protein